MFSGRVRVAGSRCLRPRRSKTEAAERVQQQKPGAQRDAGFGGGCWIGGKGFLCAEQTNDALQLFYYPCFCVARLCLFFGKSPPTCSLVLSVGVTCHAGIPSITSSGISRHRRSVRARSCASEFLEVARSTHIVYWEER